MAQLLTWSKLVEGVGAGVPRAVADCQAVGAPEPSVITDDSTVTVIIYPRVIKRAPSESSERLPTYRRVAEDLRERIEAEDLRPGEQLPTERRCSSWSLPVRHPGQGRRLRTGGSSRRMPTQPAGVRTYHAVQAAFGSALLFQRVCIPSISHTCALPSERKAAAIADMGPPRITAMGCQPRLNRL